MMFLWWDSGDLGAKQPLVAWDEGQGFLFAVVPAFQPVLAKRRPRNLNVMRASRIRLAGNACGGGDEFEGAQPCCVIVDIGYDHELVGGCFLNERINA